MLGLTTIFSAKDKVSQSLSSMSQKASGFSKTLKTVGKVGAASFAAVSTAVGTYATKAVTDFANFESEMNKVFTMMPGASQKTMGEMTKHVKDFSREMGVIPEKVTPALYQALSAGVPQDNVFEFLKQSQKAAVGGVSDVETAVDGLSTIINSYGSDVMSAQKASDLMFVTMRLGKTDFNQLSASLFNVLPSAAAANVKFEDISASLAAMTAQGVPTSVATTKVRAAIDEMSKAGTKTSDLFKQLSGKSFKDFIKGGGNLQQAFQILEKHAKKSNLGINDLFSSVEAGSAALALTGKGTQKFSEAMKEMRNAAGATDAAYKQVDKGLKRSWEKIQANIKVALLDLGEQLAPGVAAFSDCIESNMPHIEAIINTTVGVIGDIIKPAAIVVKDFGKAIYYLLSGKGLYDSLTPMLEHMDDVLYTTFGKGTADKISDFVHNSVANLGTFGESIGNLFKGYGIYEAFTPMLEMIDDALYTTFGRETADKISDFVHDITMSFDGITSSVASEFKVLKAIFTGEGLGKAIEELKGHLTDAFGDEVAENMTDAVVSIGNTLKGFCDFTTGTVVPALKDVASFVVETILPAIGNLSSSFLGGAISVIMEVFNTFADNVLPKVQNSLQVVGSVAKVAFGEVFTWIASTLLPMLQQGFEYVFPVIKNVVEDVGIIFGVVFSKIGSIVTVLLAIFSWVWPSISGIVTGAVSLIVDIASGLITTFGGIIDFITGIFTGNWSKAWEGVKEIFRGIFHSLIGIAKAPINSIIGFVNTAIGGINSIGFTAPKWVPGIGGKSFKPNIPTIPALATGTDFWPGGSALVGEAGPELVMGPKVLDMDRGSRVIPHNETSDLLKSMDSGKTINDNRSYSISLPDGGTIRAQGEDDFKQKVKSAIEQILEEDDMIGGDACYDF